MSDTPRQTIKLFYCYAREDKALRDKLQVHLSDLRRRYQLIDWYDREILPGENWEQAIDHHLSTADVILLLISPDFMNSDYCYGIEMQRALERHQAGTCSVIPILIRPIYWEEAPFRGIQMLPTDTKPITRWTDLDEAFYDVVKGISQVIKALLLSRENTEGLLGEGSAFDTLNQAKKNDPFYPPSQLPSVLTEQPNKPTTLEQFDNNETGYLRWVKENPSGFVINASRPTPSSYLKLHRATCSQIYTTTRTNYTTKDYFKVCSLSKGDLINWAKNQRGKLESCKLCNP